MIFGHEDISFEETRLEERTMAYVQKGFLSPGSKAGEIPFIPATVFLSVLRISADVDPRPGVEGTG